MVGRWAGLKDKQNSTVRERFVSCGDTVNSVDDWHLPVCKKETWGAYSGKSSPWILELQGGSGGVSQPWLHIRIIWGA